MNDRLYIIGRKILYKELEPLFEALSSIRYAVVKGEVLSRQIYGVSDKRKSSDIDILIDRNNVNFLESQLQQLGFEQHLPETIIEARLNRVLCMTCSHQIPSYHKEKLGFYLNVDVNHDIFWGEYEGKRCSIDEFLCDTTNMEIYGINVKTLSIEKSFIQMILHHYKEMNSLYILSRYNRIQTSMFEEIQNMLINNCEVLTAGRVRDLCEKFLIGNYVYYMIYYTFFVFRTAFLNEYLSVLELYRDEELIASCGLCSKERKRWSVLFENRINNNDLPNILLSDFSKEDEKKIALNENIFM